MKKYLLLPILISTSLLSFGQADIWQPIETNGFGNNQNYDIVEFETFNGNIYCATGRSGTGNAQIRYSLTGNAGTWNQITSFNPALHPSVKGFPSFGKTDSDGGIMWVATGSGIGTRIYRTTDGINFTAISQRGFNNNAGLITPSPNMVVFQGSADSIPYLYAGGGSHGGSTNAEVWRIPYNSTDSLDWVRLIDFDTIPAAVIPADTVDLISYWCVWNNKIYFSTNCKGQLWESSDGKNFTQNMNVGYGFGVNSQLVIACLQVFNDTLYASTTNKITGGQMYRTGDGINWQSITTNAFGKNDAAEELHNIDTAFGYIWVTAYTDTTISNGCPIWRSADGVNFIQSNNDGFGNPLIDGENPVTISFGNNMYFGGPNYVDGAQIWRTDMTTGINESDINQYSIKLFPNPFSTETTLQINKFLINSTLTIENCFGQNLKQIKNISGQSITLHRDNLPVGLYFIRLTEEGKVIATKKLLITE